MRTSYGEITAGFGIGLMSGTRDTTTFLVGAFALVVGMCVWAYCYMFDEDDW